MLHGEALLQGFQHPRGGAFRADYDGAEAGLAHEAEQFRGRAEGVEAHGVQGRAVGMAGELFAQREGVREGVVEGRVHELEVAHLPIAPGPRELLPHRLGRAGAVLGSLQQGIGAIRALKRAAAFALNGKHGPVAEVAREIEPAAGLGIGEGGEVGDARRRVGRIEGRRGSARGEVIQERGEGGFSIADDDVIGPGAVQHFVRGDVHRRAAEDSGRGGMGAAKLDERGHLGEIGAGAQALAVIEIANGEGDDLGRPGLKGADQLLLRVAREAEIEHAHLVTAGGGRGGHQAEAQRRHGLRGAEAVGMEEEEAHDGVSVADSDG